MIVIPAIDLKDGRCVRLFQGDMSQDVVYSDDPAATAVQWQSAGAERLHVVDLNGAFVGKPVNDAAVRSILDVLTIPMQLGGGVRTLETMDRYFRMGVRTVILGSAAFRDPKLVRQACKLFPGKVSVGIDAREGKVAVEGWAETTTLAAVELAKRFEDAGVAEIIFTDIQRDGALRGPNVGATRALAEATTIPVILSGGISGLPDIRQILKHAGPFANGNRISGAITGKAIYDGRLDFSEAVRLTRAH
ncbi:MAG: 1-(5-phosphoribosyl)-5-[(5-phosphoribosylamino)methylideneamino]imidazole-4-carboxamide isomerase [Magnetococcales bacterium]|nr:1-(5-phosphoribosyl)-5-[(5-phosphoribosylamino)methylideneamino]imidazole-4-carboxamide isomerase [Magnetococcales bacterium]